MEAHAGHGDGATPTVRRLVRALVADARLRHRLAHPDASLAPRGWAALLPRSRGLLAVTMHRLTNAVVHWQPTTPGGRAARAGAAAATALGRYVSTIVTKTQILRFTEFEDGVYLSDRGHIVLGARALGAGTIVHHCVTIGKRQQDTGRPQIGRNVWIGPGSLIYGDIRIGDGATILPDTVLTRSIPAGAVVQGSPARVLSLAFDNSVLRRTTLVPVEGALPGATEIESRHAEPRRR